MKKEFEKSLYILRNGTEKDENTVKTLGDEREFLTLNNMVEPKDCNEIEPLCELKETAEDDFAADYSEVMLLLYIHSMSALFSLLAFKIHACKRKFWRSV